jgi:uncharacterized protein
MGGERGTEWPNTLDVRALKAGGWQPVPFREFIVKVHSRCDLSCDYCYIYEMADQSWRNQPVRMSVDTAKTAARRIGEHVRAHGLRQAALIVHGGEPLLAGHDLILTLVEATRKAVGPGVRLDARIQTNGVGLDEPYLQLFAELGVRIGVSLDGGPRAHDRHRRFASGRGSYAAVAAGLERLRKPEFLHLFAGLLCAIDLRNDPIETYEALASFQPPVIDFLLPHGTWDDPPPGRVHDPSQTPYANWLIRVFDHWYGRPSTRIRVFEEVMRLLLGQPSTGESVGLAPAQMVVIEADGSIEQVDSLKATYDGATATGLHISRDPLDDALALPGMVARQIGVTGLAATCRGCPIHLVCGGGQYTHRYRTGVGFANPSVYCPDLMALISHIRDVLQADVRGRLETLLWSLTSSPLLPRATAERKRSVRWPRPSSTGTCSCSGTW